MEQVTTGAFDKFELSKQIKHTVDASEDVCYIVTMDVSDKYIACAGSNNIIKLYNPLTFELVNHITAHTDSIHQIKFIESHVLVSCSSDKTVKIFDCDKGVLIKSLAQKGESFTIDINGELMAVGVGYNVAIWNLKTFKLVREFDAHTEDVTRVLFFKPDPSKLLSCSVDGLINIYDLKVEDVEDAVTDTLNGDHSLATIGFVGDNCTHLYSLSTTERLCLFDLQTLSRVHDYGDTRTLIQEKLNIEVNYFVTCHFDQSTGSLYLFGGDYSGTFYIFLVKENELVPIGKLANGHSDIIRSVIISKDKNQIITSGEDGNLCVWSNSQSNTSIQQQQSSSSKIKSTSPPARGKASPY